MTIWMKIMEQIKNEENYHAHCLFRTNVGDVKMKSLISNRMTIMRISSYKMFHRKFKNNDMSIIEEQCHINYNIEFIIAQKDHKRWYQKCDFHLSTPLIAYLYM